MTPPIALAVAALGIVVASSVASLLGSVQGVSAGEPAVSATSCHLGNGVQQVVSIVFDNVHFFRDTPCTPANQAPCASNAGGAARFAWNRGYYAPTIDITWVGFVGPGVARRGLDGNAPDDDRPSTTRTATGTLIADTAALKSTNDSRSGATHDALNVE
jgi:hypothetical protein